jgi:glycosyltransferase involved in cell wall biosynthesis
LQALQTLRILVQERPRLIFVQSPPLFAAQVVMLYAWLARVPVVIDAHSGALIAPWWRWSLPWHAALSRRAVATIVTNTHLQALVDSWHAPSFIIADIPTVFPAGIKPALPAGLNLVVINTFSPDEPLEAVRAAAATLPEVNFFVTGDPIRADRALLARCPANMQFTGFLPDPDYVGLLRAADGVLALTTDDYTMQRGACEAVSLGVPIITSDWPILRDYFHQGTVHVDNTPAGIRQGVLRLAHDQARLRREILALQAERRAEWQVKHAALAALIAGQRAGRDAALARSEPR